MVTKHNFMQSKLIFFATEFVRCSTIRSASFSMNDSSLHNLQSDSTYILITKQSFLLVDTATRYFAGNRRPASMRTDHSFKRIAAAPVPMLQFAIKRNDLGAFIHIGCTVMCLQYKYARVCLQIPESISI